METATSAVVDGKLTNVVDGKLTNVVDGKLTNEELGGLHRRVGELVRRINEGTITYDWVIGRLQMVVEGRQDWQVWKTVLLGTHKDPNELIRTITDKGMNVSDWSKDIMSKHAFTVAPEPTELQLVRVSVAELGFPQGATREDIYERAMRLGLSIVPAEVGPQLRLQYEDQPSGEYLRIGMEPITDSGGRLRVFDVGRGCVGRWLGTHYGDPGDVWGGDDVWVFALRK